MTMGRPYGSKLLTPELVEALEADILTGLPLYIAGEKNGVLRSNIQLWMTNGQKFALIDEDDLDAAKKEYVDFFVRIKKAHAEFLSARTINACKDGNIQWARDVTILERRDREHWTKGERREHSGPDGKPIAIAAVELSDDDLAAMIKGDD